MSTGHPTRWRITRSIAGSMAVLLVVAPMALANEFAAGYRDGAVPIFDGISGRMGIRTDPATVSGQGYVHIVQADVGATGGDFVAVGTYKSQGTSSCADDFDPKWNGYWDRVTAGVYLCDDFSADVYSAGAVLPFEIAYKWCDSSVANRWVLTFNLNVVQCSIHGQRGLANHRRPRDGWD